MGSEKVTIYGIVTSTHRNSASFETTEACETKTKYVCDEYLGSYGCRSYISKGEAALTKEAAIENYVARANRSIELLKMQIALHEKERDLALTLREATQ